MKHIKPIHSFTTLLTYFLPISLALALAACGGGGGDSSPPTPTETPIAPSISTQPADQPVVAPATASFSVVATGTAPLGYQWLKNGANIPGATSSSYTTPATDTGHNGVVFTVVVSNSAGQATSNAAMLTVSPPPVAPSIGTQPAAQSVIKGSTATFSVSATGTAPLRYQWKRGSTPIDGATASSYTTPATHLETDNGAIFSVVVSNNVGTVTSSPATLGVTATAVAPGIGTQPADQSVLPGATASFSVIATGTAPLRYQWKRGSTPIDGATSSSYTTPPTSLTDHDALFSVAITNTEGTVTSNTARLTVTDVAAAPTISSQPAPSQTVNEGQTASFSVIATGTAPLRYQWKKNGVDISGATSSTYTTPATVIGDNAAVFRVVVSNSVGTVTSNPASLTVHSAPVITTQPTAQSINAGTAATFSVAATGTGPLAFQWKKAGTPIPGATSNTYTTPAMSIAGTGVAYSVVVSNGVGTATSNTALLTVHRASATPDYAEVANASGGTYAKTECVKDNSTGLVWEAKTNNGGARSLNDTFTNFDNTTSAQKGDGSNPTQTEIDARTNSVGYALTMNSGSGLCGFHDWRLPTKDELNGIVNTSNIPKIDNTWFPYTSSVFHWTSSPIAGDPSKAICIIFNFQYDSNGSSCVRAGPGPTAVRLVRGNQ